MDEYRVTSIRGGAISGKKTICEDTFVVKSPIQTMHTILFSNQKCSNYSAVHFEYIQQEISAYDCSPSD